MKEIYNPSMQEEPFNHPTRIIPLNQEETILSWLENAGRLLPQVADIDKDYDVMSDDFVDEIIEADSYQEESEDEEL